jgi:4-amino-4-deoxy-L-arabinose transferase-like glycosyltransferase
MRVNRSDARLALALFCLFTCLYWLTARAHIDIQDAETMYLVTEGLVERGTFAQLEQAQAGDAPRAVSRAPDGNLYAITGPLQSLLAVPVYTVGSWVARAFPTPFYGYFTRFFVCLFNGPVCAATAALLYLLGVDLNYRRRTALFVAMAYGLATVAWPYARTFFAETLHTFWLVLATWAVYRYARTGCWGWMTLTGIAIGLGIATKYAMAVAAPAFALYLLLEFRRQPGWRIRWHWAGRVIIAGGLPVALIILALMAFNYARFGSLLETGYTASDYTASDMLGSVDTWLPNATPLVALYGYYLSLGKGFFFFSPPTLLSFWGVSALARRHRNETWLMLATAVAYPLFYSFIIPGWHGGANWGPRYIVCTTPFLILPVGAFLERHGLRWWRVGSATLLFVLGFWIQMSTVFVDYSTYVFSNVPFEHQLFYPADSTLWAQWRLWPRQMSAWQRYDHALRASGKQFYVIDGDFYDVEVSGLAPFGRWMKDRGRLRIYAVPQQSLTVRVAYSRPRAADGDAAWKGLHFVYDGKTVISERQRVAENQRESQWVETLTIPAGDVHVFPGTVEMTTTTWVPIELGDPRTLGVFMERAEVLSDGSSLPIYKADLPRPLPVSSAYPWSWKAMLWFYDPSNARPFDIWVWHVWTSGVSLAKAQTFITLLALLLGTSFVFSSVWFILAVKSSLNEKT